MRNFTLFSLVRIALKHIVILIVAGLVFATGTFAYCKFVAVPVYSATGSLLITNENIISSETLDNADIVASLNFSDTVADILKTKGIFKQLSKKIDNKYTYGNLAGRTKITTADNNSLLFKVTVSANSSAEAVTLVNNYLSLAPDYLETYFPGTVATTVDETDSAGQTYPRTIAFSGIAGLIGALVAFGVLILIYSTNTIIRGEEDFLERFNVQVIGTIPDFANAHSEKYYKSSYYGGYYEKTGDKTNG